MAGGEGTIFGKYYLLKKIAAGGMGEIFLAKLKGPVGFEKLLVIKRILAQHCENQDFVDMFFAEARIAAQLSHSNIVQIYEMGEIDEAYFIGMEYVASKSLHDVIEKARAKGERLPSAHAADIISKLCAGMGYAHNAADMAGQPLGIIHRDINPHNLLVSYTGEVKIIDFGIAKSEMQDNKTETGTIKGKFVYMSPEQSAAGKLDKRSDIFAIGICLYETLAGFNPFAKSNIVMSLDAIQRQEPPPITEVSPKLAPFAPILAKALSKDPEHRYADCADMRNDLQQLLTTDAIEKPAEPLAAYMQGLFEQQIEAEKRTILEQDQANLSQLEAMREYGKQEHRSGSGQQYSSREQAGWDEGEYEGEDDIDTAPAVLETSHSRLPFLMAALLIVAATGVGSVAVWKAKHRGAPQLVIQEISPITNEPLPERPVAAPGRPEAQANAAVSPSGTPSETSATSETLERPETSERPDPSGTGDDRPSARDRHKGRDRDRPDDRRPDASAQQSASPPASTKPPPPPGFGNMQISCSPPVPIQLDDKSVGQTLKLKAAAGVLTIGAGTDSRSDPFKVSIRYRVTGPGIAYAIASEPWAIVTGKGGMGLGRTPLPFSAGEVATLFELENPKDGRKMRVSLRFTGP